MSGLSAGSCIKQLKLNFTMWTVYSIPPFSARQGPMKRHSSVSAFRLSMIAAIVVESSVSLPSCSKTEHFSVVSSNNTTPKANTSTFGVIGPASRHSGARSPSRRMLLLVISLCTYAGFAKLWR